MSEPVAGDVDGIAGRVFTVPPGLPFLDTVARAILSGVLPGGGAEAPGPLDLPSTTLLLPTRRAVRSMQDAFLRVGRGRAMLLPAIRPISEGDEDLSLLAGLGTPRSLASSAVSSEQTIGAQIGEIERRLVLTELVLKWSRALELAADDGEPFAAAGARTPAQAAHLAGDLARFIDMLETEGVSLAALEKLVPDEFAAHWQTTLDFLQIVVDWWPAHLAEVGLLSPADRRNRLILQDAERLRRMPPDGAVIIAGVTGSIPATVELMRAVGSFAHGAIVLPCLDTDLDDSGWQAALTDHPEHPQHGLARLLAKLGVDRRAVRPLAGATKPDHLGHRERFISQAMRPAATTDRWVDYLQAADRASLREALEGVSLVEAPSATDEAEVVALILREAVETPGRTAVLVSPDRRLARRVAIRLRGMGVEVDDSAGRPFAKTPIGTLLDLILAAQARDFEPTAVVSLLKHPLVRLGFSARDKGFAIRSLELAALRTLYLGRGLTGLAAALDRAQADVSNGARREQAVRRLWTEDWTRARTLVTALTDAFAPLTALASGAGDVSLQELVRAHAAVAEAIARPAEGEAPDGLWGGEGGASASLFIATLMDDTLAAPALGMRDYPDFYRSLIGNENVRAEGPVHPRIAILGPLEARLQRPDLVVLGSLNDGTWPEAADPGPWLNRPMRQTLGLPAPEERIGHAAHDFTALLGADRVVLTRALKVDGVPTVASRWLLRLRALISGAGLDDVLAPTAPWLAWARGRDEIAMRRQIEAPSPRPALVLRPRRMSVSDIETWIGNPYAIFARHVLELDELPSLGAPPDAALRGSIVHMALAQFALAHPVELPPDPAEALMSFARQILAEYTGDPRVAAFWVPRLERFARWFGETEPDRRHGAIMLHAEVSGQMALDAPAGPFLLRTRVDRIDELPTGLVITDYKTGVAPTQSKVATGAAPQLPLEAAIAAASGLGPLPPKPVLGLRYIRATGGEPPGEAKSVADADIAGIADNALRGVARLVASFDDPSTPYRAVRRSQFRYDFDGYAHLARVAEWSGAEGDGDGDEEAAA